MSEKSNPVTCQPCSARNSAFRPWPIEMSSALPGVRSLMTSSTKGLGRNWPSRRTNSSFHDSGCEGSHCDCCPETSARRQSEATTRATARTLPTLQPVITRRVYRSSRRVYTPPRERPGSVLPCRVMFSNLAPGGRPRHRSTLRRLSGVIREPVHTKGDPERSPLEIQSATELGQAGLPRSHGIHGHGTLGRNVVLEAVNRAVLALVQAQHTETRSFLSRVECQIAGMVDVLILEK